jgi:hypothetical protein
VTSSGHNYCGQDVRGRSFARRDLAAAGFVGADVRGCDFSHADLAGADFTDATLGVRPLAATLILAGSAVVSILTGVAVGLLLTTIADDATSSDWRDIMAAILLGLVVLVSFGMVMVKGVAMTFKTYLLLVVGVVALDYVVVRIFAGEIRFRNSYPLIALLLLFLPAAVAGMLGRIVAGSFRAWAIAMVAVLGGLAAGRVGGALLAIPVSLFMVFISKRALAGDGRDRVLREIAHRIVSHRGTRFIGADLSGADFSGTLLTHSNVSQATLDGAIWDDGMGPQIESDA